MAAALRGRGRHIVTSAIEHPAVLEVCRALQRAGFDITRLPVDGDGLVDPRAVERALGPGTLMVSIMHANNETGALQPIEEIARICRAHGVVLHTDAAQSLGKVPVDVQRLGVDLLSIAGHKLYAPKGVGALFIRSPLAPEPLLYGAGQEMGRRAGTQNVLLIAGLGAACEIAGRDLPRCMETMCRLRDRMQALLLDDAAPARVNGPLAARLPNTLSISFRDLEAGRILEEIGPEVAASAGAACHAGTLAVSHVLEAMGLPPEWAQGTLRLSLGRPSREEQIERAAAVVGDAVRRLRKRS
jgi:cysteine desulfurase